MFTEIIQKSNFFSPVYGLVEKKQRLCELVSSSLELIINYRWQIDLRKAIVSIDKIKLIACDETACIDCRKPQRMPVEDIVNLTRPKAR